MAGEGGARSEVVVVVAVVAVVAVAAGPPKGLGAEGAVVGGIAVKGLGLNGKVVLSPPEIPVAAIPAPKPISWPTPFRFS